MSTDLSMLVFHFFSIYRLELPAMFELGVSGAASVTCHLRDSFEIFDVFLLMSDTSLRPHLAATVGSSCMNALFIESRIEDNFQNSRSEQKVHYAVDADTGAKLPFPG